MNIRETPEALILRDQPGCIWLFSAFFILIGSLFVLGPLFFMSDRFEQPWYVIALAVFMGLAGVGVGVWQVGRVPLSEITFHRADRSICRVTWGLGGRREQRWSFSDVEALEVVEEKDSEGDSVYRLRLNLRNDRAAWLTGVHLHSAETYARAAQCAQEFLGLKSRT